jgi:integration host factor subunit alpha
MALTKDELAKALADEAGFPQNQSRELVEILLGLIKAKLTAGEDVLVSGFGKFCVRQKRERRGRNPATGESMALSPRKIVTFKCSHLLRKKINGA